MAADSRSLALLGPQHERPNLREVLDGMGAAGPYVLVSAGWQERESETGRLDAHLGEPVRSLDLWPRCEAAFEADSDLRHMMFGRHDRMKELSTLYRVRLAAELAAARELMGRTRPDQADPLVGPSLDLACGALRDLDDLHCSRVGEINEEVFGEAAGRESLRAGRAEIAEVLDGAGTLLVAGGHVGILYNRMRLFGVRDALPASTPVVGWSAGAMVLTDRILLFHDSPPQGPGDAEFLGPGLGLAPGVVVLPHASRRLDLDDRGRVALLARRLAPELVVALDDGDRLEAGADGWSGEGARRLTPAGAVVAELMEVGA
jgi:hypothetical protein